MCSQEVFNLIFKSKLEYLPYQVEKIAFHLLVVSTLNLFYYQYQLKPQVLSNLMYHLIRKVHNFEKYLSLKQVMLSALFEKIRMVVKEVFQPFFQKVSLLLPSLTLHIHFNQYISSKHHLHLCSYPFLKVNYAIIQYQHNVLLPSQYTIQIKMVFEDLMFKVF